MFTVITLYKFVAIDDIAGLISRLKSFTKELDIRGTLLVAKEGINGTVAGSGEAILSLKQYFKTEPLLSDLEYKESYTDIIPFRRMKVRLKKEIVTLGIPSVDPTKLIGDYVEAKDWNKLISDPDVLVIDVRNEYEVSVGNFKNAHNPKTRIFREFPNFVREISNKQQKIAMYCTGGIRCEKASSFMKAEGFKEVYQLKGGILKYLEEIPVEKSLWQGTCFVFDERESLNHELKPQE